ncbi:Protein of unknown function [Bacillus mycoides]|nr:Protein of unknown function [Bacillus mycoides]
MSDKFKGIKESSEDKC